MDTKNASFYLIIPPGLENLAKMEFEEKWALFFPHLALPEITLEKGGLSLTTSLKEGCHLNQILKIPSRILLRIESFKCRDFPKLFKKIKKMPWNQFLLGVVPEVKVTSHKSRLINTKRISEVVKDGIEAFYKSNTPKKSHLDLSSKAPLTLHIRFEDDDCSLSLDTSGEHLHKRGYKTQTTKAPLRENFAAALVYALHKWSEKKDKLYDPMCGSGSFLFEALTFYSPNKWRTFPYPSIPLLQKEDCSLPSPDKNKTLFSHIVGGDQDQKAIQAAIENFNNLDIDQSVFEIKNEDFLKLDFTSKENVIIINPPYGKRIAQESAQEHLIQEIISKSKEATHHLGLLLPTEQFKNVPVPKERLRFSNGGLDVTFGYFYFS